MSDGADPPPGSPDDAQELHPREGHEPHEPPPDRRRLYLILAPIAVLWVCAQVGDALAPSLAAKGTGHPLLLIILNARNRNLLLVTNQLEAWEFYVVGTLRLLAADPPFYLLGYYYGDAAVSWIEAKSPTMGRYARQFETAFAKAAYPLVFIAPNNFICLFAGSAGMRPVWFVSLNLAGTVTRLWLIRATGEAFQDQVDWVLDLVTRYRWQLTAVTIALVVFSMWSERRQGKSELGGVRDLIEGEAPGGTARPDEEPDQAP